MSASVVPTVQNLTLSNVDVNGDYYVGGLAGQAYVATITDVTVTIKNGKVISGENTWCTVMAAGISADVKMILNLVDMTIESNKPGDLAVKAWSNGVIYANGVTVRKIMIEALIYSVPLSFFVQL